jgi:uncharacterized protein (DUF1684 family)
MDAYEPFTGVLLLPDRAPFGQVSEVTLADGRPVAQIRWHRWSMAARFDILDATGTTELAAGGRVSRWSGRGYAVTGPGGGVLIEVKMNAMRRGARVTLPGGPELTTRGNWSGRRFQVLDADGLDVARIVTTSGLFTLRPDSMAFEVARPVLSIVQAVGLTQCLRAVLEASRQTSASS